MAVSPVGSRCRRGRTISVAPLPVATERQVATTGSKANSSVPLRRQRSSPSRRRYPVFEVWDLPAGCARRRSISAPMIWHSVAGWSYRQRSAPARYSRRELQLRDRRVESLESVPCDRLPRCSAAGAEDPGDVVQRESGVLEHPDEHQPAQRGLAVPALSRLPRVRVTRPRRS